MKLGIAKETLENENRVAALPESVRVYVAMGFEVLVETNAGAGAFVPDERYVEAGARIVADAPTLFASSDIVIKVKQPHLNAALGRHEAEMLREGSILVTFLHPAAPVNHDMIRTLRRPRHHLPDHGRHPAHLPGTDDGRPHLDEHGHRLQGGAHRRLPVPAVHPHDRDGHRHDQARQVPRDRLRRGGPAGHRHRQAPRSLDQGRGHQRRGRQGEPRAWAPRSAVSKCRPKSPWSRAATPAPCRRSGWPGSGKPWPRWWPRPTSSS